MVETPEGRHELRGRIAPFKLFQAATDEIEKQIRHVELLRSWEHDAIPLIDATQARKILSVLSLQSLVPGDERGTIHRLRTLLEATCTVRDEELANALADVTGGLRSIYIELPPKTYSLAIDRIGAWAAMSVEPLDLALTAQVG